MPCESKNWLVKEKDVITLWLDGCATLSLGIRFLQRKLRNRLKLKSTREFLQDKRRSWFGHLGTMEVNAWSSKCIRLVVVSLENDLENPRMR